MDSNVYLGVWTNWSNGTVMGSTLTTTRRDGNLLIAFTGFLIPFVASRFWSIICLIFHIHYSSVKSKDAIHHQRQILLRNSSSPETGLLSLFRLFWAWRKSEKEDKRHFHLLPIILIAVCCVSAFTAAGGFSSQISTAPGDEVLMRGDNCSFLQLPTNVLGGNLTSVMSGVGKLTSQSVNDAANYAQQCYSADSSGILDCDKFVLPSLPTAVWDNNTGCPFQDDICRTNTSNLLLDSGYIDSNDDLGINAPEDQRFALRYVLQCAPLVTQGHATEVSIQNRTWVRYNYGTLANEPQSLNFTYETYGLDTQYPFGVIWGTGSNLKLSKLFSPTFQGMPYSAGADFVPLLQLFRPDGDLNLLFLSGNGISFLNSMDDDWYRATVPNELVNFAGEGTATSFTPVEAASPMGCVEQWQWCNSAYPRESGCGPLAGFMDALFGAAALFNLTQEDLTNGTKTPTAAGARFIWSAAVLDVGVASLHVVTAQLGAKSLASQALLDSALQYPLPLNQWQLDVTNWFNTILAGLQATYVEMTTGITDPALKEFAMTPSNAGEHKICNSQKVLSTSYSSFSLFGLLFTYIIGSLIIIISFVMEPILRTLQKRRKYKEYAILEWTTNEALQLHRLANEELQLGTWSGCTDMIPTTKRGEMLASLDISDLDHPILAPVAEKAKQKNNPHGGLRESSMEQAQQGPKLVFVSIANSVDGDTLSGDQADDDARVSNSQPPSHSQQSLEGHGRYRTHITDEYLTVPDHSDPRLQSQPGVREPFPRSGEVDESHSRATYISLNPNSRLI
ncbi:uncharacterized protein LY89DRAFT_778879 [Mollisia scopiformis]|uniref:Uncharacterized protein n=1 Tax=Mollisia scopiformis TaxID=149040 RepID=A0A194XMI9_MOLSC|nr:uncharacterized protein LY89DRAFT_778879 [Mollisia scopiformis]KUJ21309.1 hypothetical protein LY89DRAFT_778879 [Mollisia scopiformis]